MDFTVVDSDFENTSRYQGVVDTRKFTFLNISLVAMIGLEKKFPILSTCITHK